ncbi:TPR-repeat-containing protein [Gallibacterium salpingitidis]|uniref:c-type cytochrome biogenesis protein CcmI n=1 Tax=Gallibacterium salpingitidis TaxID=505341 RepID=UPI000805399E|nr:c-type cytochrome biogenesis protein CcmI [Gallibacterium salpingitidis]OBX08129.1 TPR-repeat-containing protein [Gallibacterium salpingitidis]
MSFWLSALGLTLVIALICFFPLLRQRKQQKNIEREAFNKAFYFDRLKELEQSAAQGLLDNEQQLKIELQQALLADIPSKTNNVAQSQQQFGKVWFVTAFLLLFALAGASYFAVGSWRTQEMLEQSYTKLPQLFARLQDEQKKPLSDSEIEQFIVALRLDLQKHPENAENWWLLGQMGMATDKAQLAMDSYAKAYQLVPTDLTYKLSYARILMFSQDQNDNSKGRTLLSEVIRQDHSNADALGLLAFDSFQRGDYKMAIVSWNMMLQLLAPDDPKRQLLERSIENARQELQRQEQSQQK